jgi:pilus assembly protein CpaB
MNASRMIVLGVAVFSAIGAGYIAKNMAAPPPPTVVVKEQPTQPRIQLDSVLVASEDLPIGVELQGQMRWQPWPDDALNESYITKSKSPDAINELRGSVVRLSFASGEPIRKTKLVEPGKSFMSSILPKGKRAVATQISADTSAGGFILPNDFVDVIMSRRAKGNNAGGDGYITETILKNIRVLAIDQNIQEDEQGRKVKVGQTATLELTPEQAEIITVAQQMADRLTLALRSTADVHDTANDQADYLVSGEGRGGRIRMIKLGQVSEVGAN